jgi:type II secretory pathway pseudopilin PulG
VFGAPRPPQPFLQTGQSFYEKQRQEEADKRLARALQIIEREEKKETPGKITSGAPMSRQPTTVEVFGVPKTGFSIPSSATSVPLSSRSSTTPMQAVSALSPSLPSVSLSQKTAQLISQSQVGIEKAQILRRTLSQGAQPAPNAGNQPSVDVDGEGKEEEVLQPQQPAMTFVQASPPPQPYAVASSASSSQAGAPSFHKINLDIFGDSDEESDSNLFGSDDEEEDSIKRAQLLEEATQIRESLMKKTGTPLPGLLRKDGKLTPKGNEYFIRLEAYITNLKRFGTPLLDVPKFNQ